MSLNTFDSTKKEQLSGVWIDGNSENGEWKCFYINGQLLEHYFHKDGQLDGEYKFFNFIGDLVIHRIYKENKTIEDYLKEE